MGLRIETIAKSKRKQEIKEIYADAFQKEDRMPFTMMLLMSFLWHTKFLVFYEGETLCGFVYLAKLRKVTFIMFFAVAEDLRSKGYGGCILDQIEKMYPNQKIIVSIEPCCRDAGDLRERIRRKGFYLNNGFVESGYFMKLGKEQEILIKNGEFNKREFILFFMLYSNLTTIPKIWSV